MMLLILFSDGGASLLSSDFWLSNVEVGNCAGSGDSDRRQTYKK